MHRDDMPLRPMMGARAFVKKGIDFVGPIDPLAMETHTQYIIIAIDYVTKWVEIKATQRNDSYTSAKYLFEYIFMRYSLPIKIVSDRGKHLLNEVIENLQDKFMVLHKNFAPYHPQANDQAKSTNKILKMVLTKIVSESKIVWGLKLHLVMWAYQVAYKMAIGSTPFNMIYGLDAILPLEFLVPMLRIAQEIGWIGHKLFNRV